MRKTKFSELFSFILTLLKNREGKNYRFFVIRFLSLISSTVDMNIRPNFL